MTALQIYRRGRMWLSLGVPGFVAWLLARLPKYEIRSRDGTELYLTRRWIFGHKTSKWALMLHQMHTPDPDACHHDHPWRFWTLILKGGYVEEITDRDGTLHDMVNWPGALRFRPALHAHRIRMLLDGECWTLVLRGPYERSWGFHTEDGWIWWETFIAGRLSKAVAWCADGVSAVKRRRALYQAAVFGEHWSRFNHKEDA